MNLKNPQLRKNNSCISGIHITKPKCYKTLICKATPTIRRYKDGYPWGTKRLENAG